MLFFRGWGGLTVVSRESSMSKDPPQIQVLRCSHSISVPKQTRGWLTQSGALADECK